MKKLSVVLLACLVVSPLLAVPDIEFVDSQSPGGWYYDGADTFSFTQPVNVSDVQGGGTDTLNGMFVHIPDLVLSGYFDFGSSASANVTPQASLEIWDTQDTSGTKLLEADFTTSGSFFAYYSTASVYAEVETEMTVTALNNSIASNLLSGIGLGTQLGWSLTLNHEDSFLDFMYQTPAQSANNGFSGQINIIPEPMTLALMAVGTALIGRRGRRSTK